MTKLARVHGVSRISAALGVEYYALKDRLEGMQKRALGSPPNLPTFVELKPLAAGQPRGCLVELEDGCGRKMTLRWDAGHGVDPLALVQAFWRRRP
jgi:hypothetical protein